MKPEGIFRFGEFQIDSLARTLRREKELVTLNRRAFDVLLYLAQNPGRVVSRDELLRNAWPDAFVDENSLAQSISVLRRALEEKPGDNSYVVTLPGRGYQFVAPVQVLAPERSAVVPDVTTSANDRSAVIVQQQTIRTNVVTEESASSGAAALPEVRAARVPKLWKIAVPVLLVAFLGAGGLYYRYYRSHQKQRLTEKDTVVLADFANSTGDAIFDDTLKTGLNISLRQSPFLNLLPDGQVAKTLKLMTRPAGTKLTPEVTRELCQRAGCKAYIAGSIDSLGNEYVLGLKGVNCLNGDTLAEEQVTAASKEKVLDALGEAASKLRGELGESLATVQKFDVPLAQGTTSSLEALQAYTLGVKTANQKGPVAGLPYFERAITLDPTFAIGYAAIGSSYLNLGAVGRAGEYITKAFQLRGHASERESLGIVANYYQYVLGDLDKSAQAYREQIESYPRVIPAYANLSIVFAKQGQYEKAVDITRQGLRLAPERVGWYENLATYNLALQHFDETRQVIHEAEARKLDDSGIHDALYALAFLGSDSSAMAEQEQWYAARADYQTLGQALASDTEAYSGHLDKARELTKQAIDSSVRANSPENGARWEAIAAQREAAFGYSAQARQRAADALKLAPANQMAQSHAALALAMAGETARAESLAQDLEKRFPLDTQMQSLWLPTIRAQLALHRKNPVLALNALPPASPIDLGLIMGFANSSCLFPIYVRGEAYLAAGQGSTAAAEFQKILDHSGIGWNCWTGALAHLGVARANVLQSRAAQGADADAARVRALAAYRDFLTLWKDADPDIPILKQAKVEYAELTPHKL
jgi:DNA-binding winged helix-turn-helix (wHTH) protein/Tfp pilus assembly protein PilF